MSTSRWGDYVLAGSRKVDHIRDCSQCAKAQSPLGNSVVAAPFVDWCGVLPCPEGARLEQDYLVAYAASMLDNS